MGVDAGAPLRGDQCGGAVLGHDCWAGENIASAEVVSPVQTGFSGAVVKHELHGFLWQQMLIARTRSELLGWGFVGDSGSAAADIYNFYLFIFVMVAVTHFMGAMEREDDIPSN